MPKPSSKPTRSAAELIPDRPTIDKVRVASKDCQACALWRRATQTVFGAGTKNAQLMFVGEQPGNDEDLSGHPFVGPAGTPLDRALADAGIDRSAVYLTNVVKHFKWEPRGKRRIHKKPNAMEIKACRPWLEAEISVVKPRVIVCLGSTAAQAVPSPLAPLVLATVHPSSILRALDDETRRAEMQAFTDDLRKVAKALRVLR